MKDALGHGSNGNEAPPAPEAPRAREAAQRPMAKEAVVAKEAKEAAPDSRVRGVGRPQPATGDLPPGAQGAKMILHALGQGHPKSAPVPVHSGAAGRLNAWGQNSQTARQVRSQLRDSRAQQLHKPPSQRRSYP